MLLTSTDMSSPESCSENTEVSFSAWDFLGGARGIALICLIPSNGIAKIFIARTLSFSQAR